MLTLYTTLRNIHRHKYLDTYINIYVPLNIINTLYHKTYSYTYISITRCLAETTFWVSVSSASLGFTKLTAA